MPDISFECSNCGQQIDAPRELANQLIECPNCKQTIEVPVRSRIAKPHHTIPLQPPPILLTEANPALSSVEHSTSNLSPIKKLEYSVVPFVAVIPLGKGSDAAAAQLQFLIDTYARDDWEYVRLESVETCIQGNDGCFGIGATPPRMTVYSMAVFKR